MGYFAMQHSTQADYKALQINATPLQRIASQTRAIQIKHEAMWGEFLSLSLSLSR